MLSHVYADIYSQERRATLQREAEMERLIKLSKSGQAKQLNLYQMALSSLGTQMIHWGIPNFVGRRFIEPSGGEWMVLLTRLRVPRNELRREPHTAR